MAKLAQSINKKICGLGQSVYYIESVNASSSRISVQAVYKVFIQHSAASTLTKA